MISHETIDTMLDAAPPTEIRRLARLALELRAAECAAHEASTLAMALRDEHARVARELEQAQQAEREAETRAAAARAMLMDMAGPDVPPPAGAPDRNGITGDYDRARAAALEETERLRADRNGTAEPAATTPPKTAETDRRKPPKTAETGDASRGRAKLASSGSLALDEIDAELLTPADVADPPGVAPAADWRAVTVRSVYAAANAPAAECDDVATTLREEADIETMGDLCEWLMSWSFENLNLRPDQTTRLRAAVALFRAGAGWDDSTTWPDGIPAAWLEDDDQGDDDQRFERWRDEMNETGRLARPMTAELDPFDCELIAAVHNMQGARGRWKQRIRDGMTDGALGEAIAYEFGSYHGSHGPNRPGHEAKGGKHPGFWVGDRAGNRKPDLAGKALVDAVRRLLVIPLPSAPAPSPVPPPDAPAGPEIPKSRDPEKPARKSEPRNPGETVRQARERRKRERHAAAQPIRASGAAALEEFEAAREVIADGKPRGTHQPDQHNDHPTPPGGSGAADRPAEEWRSADLDERLRNALGWGGASERLTHCERPPTTLEIIGELGDCWGNTHHIHKHAVGYRVRGGSKPAFWMGTDDKRKPTLEGLELADRVRRALGITPDAVGVRVCNRCNAVRNQADGICLKCRSPEFRNEFRSAADAPPPVPPKHEPDYDKPTGSCASGAARRKASKRKEAASAG